MKLNNIKNLKFIVKTLLVLSGLSSFGIILIASVLNIYSQRGQVANLVDTTKSILSK